MHKASELASDERILLERWLGRPLASDETISVNAWQWHPPPAENRRDSLRRDIVSQAREIGLRAPELSVSEADDMLDEAFAACVNL